MCLHPLHNPSELVLHHPLQTPGVPALLHWCLSPAVLWSPSLTASFPVAWLQLWLPDDHPWQIPDLRQHRPLQGQFGRWQTELSPQNPCWDAPPWLHSHHMGCWHLPPLPKPTQWALTSSLSLVPQGNVVAIKHINKKRIELTRQVLFELKHVGLRAELGWAPCLKMQGQSWPCSGAGGSMSDLKHVSALLPHPDAGHPVQPPDPLHWGVHRSPKHLHHH